VVDVELEVCRVLFLFLLWVLRSQQPLVTPGRRPSLYRRSRVLGLTHLPQSLESKKSITTLLQSSVANAATLPTLLFKATNIKTKKALLQWRRDRIQTKDQIWAPKIVYYARALSSCFDRALWLCARSSSGDAIQKHLNSRHVSTFNFYWRNFAKKLTEKFEIWKRHDFGDFQSPKVREKK
jgi:hypothetical protein